MTGVDDALLRLKMGKRWLKMIFDDVSAIAVDERTDDLEYAWERSLLRWP